MTSVLRTYCKTNSLYFVVHAQATRRRGQVLAECHAVVQVGDLETAEVGRLGPAIAAHERFPEGVNAGFMQVLTPEHIRLRVHERGVGETLACGTGACAAVAVGRDRGLLAERVRVDLAGGTLQIRWSGRGEPVWMTGPAVSVITGIRSVA